MASGYNHLVIDKPASAYKLLTAIDVAEKEFTDSFSE